MPTSSSHVYIEVSPSRLELAVARGRRILRCAVRRLPAASGAETLHDALGRVQGALGELVTECGALGMKATVIYQCAAEAVLVSSAPATLGAADAEEAARLAVAGVADYPVENAPFAIRPLLTDSPASGSTAGGRQGHMLSAGERAETIDAIVAWVTSAGLRFDGAAPASAVAMHAAAVAAWSNGRRASDRAAALWVGEHGAAIACVTEGTVRFVRAMGVGMESLVDALCQPLRGRDDGAAEVRLDRSAARALLMSAGVPGPDDEIAGMPGFTGAALLPALQPALQRIMIEAKQSLRFGLPEQERGNLRLHLVGPGSLTPGLGEWVARQCGLQLAEPGPAAGEKSEQSSSTGAIAEVIAAGQGVPMLIPEQMARRVLRRHARVALACGVMMAAAWVGAEWYGASEELAEQSRRLAALEASVARGEAGARLREAAIAAREGMLGIESRVVRTLGNGADAPGVLEAVALAAPGDVRLSTIELSAEKDAALCRISGFVRVSESTDPTGAITSFVDRLSATPLFRSVRLSSAQRTRINGAQAHAFDMIVEIVPVPVAHVVGIESEAMP